MKTTSIRLSFLPRLFVVGSLSIATLAIAQVSPLNFDGGVGTVSYDQYAGASGGGWTGAWEVRPSDGNVTYSADVRSDDPLYAGGGNRLSVGITSGVEAASRQVGISRAIDPSAIDLTKAFSYSFYFRPESAPGASNDSAQYLIFSTAGNQGGPASGTTWSIQSSHSDTSVWQLGLGGGTSNFASTTMAVTAGTTYFFTVNTDPATMTYSVTISDGVTTYDSIVAGLTLQWRRTTSTPEGNLHFGLKDMTTGTVDNVAFSVDNITLSQVPEPATAGILLGGAALALVAVARRGVRR